MLGWRKDGSSIKKLLRRHSLRTVEEARWDKLTGRGRKVLKKLHLTEEKKAEEQKEDKDEKEEIFFMCQLSQSPKRVVHFLFTSQEERKKGKEGSERHPSGKICPPLLSQEALPTGHSLTAFFPLPRPTLSRSNCLGSRTEPPSPPSSASHFALVVRASNSSPRNTTEGGKEGASSPFLFRCTVRLAEGRAEERGKICEDAQADGRKTSDGRGQQRGAPKKGVEKEKEGGGNPGNFAP